MSRLATVHHVERALEVALDHQRASHHGERPLRKLGLAVDVLLGAAVVARAQLVRRRDRGDRDVQERAISGLQRAVDVAAAALADASTKELETLRRVAGLLDLALREHVLRPAHPRRMRIGTPGPAGLARRFPIHDPVRGQPD